VGYRVVAKIASQTDPERATRSTQVRQPLPGSARLRPIREPGSTGPLFWR